MFINVYYMFIRISPPPTIQLAIWSHFQRPHMKLSFEMSDPPHRAALEVLSASHGPQLQLHWRS